MNIPIELLLAECKDKRRLELLAFRVFVMLVYKNATIFDLSPEKVAWMLRCKVKVAERLIADAKKSGWFSYNSRRNSMRALSMKSEVVRIAKNNKEYRSDFCFLMRKRYISLAELVKRLRGIIILMVILQAQGKQSPKGASAESLYYIMVYQNTFAQKLGLTQGTISKLIKYLTKIRWIEHTEQVFYKALTRADHEAAEEYRRNHHNCTLMQRSSSRYYCRTKSVTYNYFGCFGLGYRAADWTKEAFRHIIWTHSKRLNAA